MKAKATIRLNLPSEKSLKAIKTSLMPETKKPGIQRAQTSIGIEENCLVLNITAEDTVALRSTLNAYLRWINAEINIITSIN